MRESIIEIKEIYIPFSRGLRICLEVYLATIEFKLIIAIVVKGFKISIRRRITDETIVIIDYFILIPIGGFCNLVFRNV